MRVCMSDVDETRCQLGLTRWSVPKFILLQQLKRSSERNAPRAGSFPELRKQIAETAEQVKDQGIWCYVSFYHVLTRSTLFRTRGRRSNPSMTKPGQTAMQKGKRNEKGGCSAISAAKFTRLCRESCRGGPSSARHAPSEQVAEPTWLLCRCAGFC
jgi:hypothetical protein